MTAVKSLDGEIVGINSLADSHIDEMYRLMNSYYDNVSRESFQRDLSEKRDIILLRNSDERKIKGFSTLMLL